MRPKFFNHILWINLISLLCFFSCSSDVEEAVITETVLDDEVEMQSMPMCLGCSRVSFDASSSTRSEGDGWSWQDGDVVYIQFHSGESLVRGYGQYNATTKQWTVYIYGTINQSDVCEVYYFEGASTTSKLKVTFNETNAVYADTLADYRISDDVIYIDAMLTPLTSRVRFAGSEGLGMTVQGITYYKGYDADKNTFSSSSSVLSASIGSDGYTQYVYGAFSDDSRHLILTNTVNNGVLFDKDFPPSVLCIGESGYITVPTIDDNDGWKVSYAVMSVSLSQNKALISSLGGTLQLSATVLPANAKDNTVKWTSSNEDVAKVSDIGLLTAVGSGYTTIKATSNMDESKFAACSVTVVNTKGLGFADLGLPSGLLWATCNIGANYPEEYGVYLAWGETTSKSSYTDLNYTYSENPSTLPLDKDAAHVRWGGDWRMPTKAELDELRDCCIWTWTTQNGVKGYKVSSKTNSNFIFLPAAGSNGYTGLSDVGSKGLYWSSSHGTSFSSYAYYLFFYSKGMNTVYDERYAGKTIRAVCQLP